MDVSDLVEERADHGNVATATFGKTIDVQADELTEGKSTDINEESSHDKKKKTKWCPRGSNTSKNTHFTLKALPDIFYTI